MSKINRIRIVNLNYNNNTMKIDDETFDLGGKSTLFSMRNGGGKSVLVQAITSIFVNKSYRNFEDRPFEGYFTGNQHTLIMCEWLLDKGNGYFLNGFMVRKNQDTDKSDEKLNIIAITGSYKSACEYDLDNIDIINVEDGRKKLKSFAECKNVFENLKKQKKGDFNTYDMMYSYGSRQYFDRLRQYGINNKEWESIIFTINQKESGLSDLFNNAKDERGLIENWIIKVIRDKLNQDKNREKEFQNLTYKFIENYRANQSKIERKGQIEKYFEDTDELKKLIDEYDNEETAQENTHNAIALYLEKCAGLLENLGAEKTAAQENLRKHQDELDRVTYERVSNTIHRYEDEKAQKSLERAEEEAHITGVVKELESVRRELCKYDCCHSYSIIKRNSQEKNELTAKLQRLVSNQEVNKEKIEEIGHELYCLYFAWKNIIASDIAEINESIKAMTDAENAKRKLIDESRASKIELSEKRGAVADRIMHFDSVENSFNTSFDGSLSRNLFHKYEDGFLTLLQKTYEDELIAENNQLASISVKIKKYSDEQKKLSAENTSIALEKQKCEIKEKELSENKINLLMQKEKRINICRLMGMVDEKCDDKAYILASLETVLREQDEKRSEYIAKLSGQRRNLANLMSGRLTELPENLKNYLDESGMDYIYGYDWLSKNAYTPKKNRELAAANPFLPYSIIVDRTTFKQMCDIESELYTQFPVPIVIRDELEKACDGVSGRIVSCENVHFFVLFDNSLLDEEGLKAAIEALQNEIEKSERSIDIIDKELENYRDCVAVVNSQEYSEAALAKLNKEADDIAAKVGELAQSLHDVHERMIQNEADRNDSDKKRKETENTIRRMESRRERFLELCTEYGEYENNLITRERLGNEIAELDKTIAAAEKELNMLNLQLQQENDRKAGSSEKAKNCDEKLGIYSAYAAETPSDIQQFDEAQAGALEAEYNALTQTIASGIDEVQRSLSNVEKTIETATQQLKMNNIYGLAKEEYSELIYSENVVRMCRDNSDRLEKEKNSVHERIAVLIKQIENASDNIKNEMQELKRQTGYDEPADRGTITDSNFGEREKIARYSIRQTQQEIENISGDMAIVTRMADLLAEYDCFACTLTDEEREAVLLQMPKFSRESKDELLACAKKLKAQDKTHGVKLEQQRNVIGQNINKLSMLECYREEYFRKTFVNLMNQLQTARGLKHQFEINIDSYRIQLEKLEIDLKNTYEERQNIELLFLEYVRDINENLASIDKNATIPVRNRSIKMLNIRVPEWDKEKEHFAQKLHDYFDTIIGTGLETIAKGGNLEEQLGRLIIAKKLYDEVAGIGNVVIKLYKIEEEREVSIAWSEVAANSGGEGFLSAFVVLVCLLSYMRRDSSDIFATGEEGKVLIMDNPFAQTNAEHLLKPLVEMAEKTNTQLLCLSGLGGDSIYSRFDNIYVLKLVDSNIQANRQYMHAEHRKGDSIRKMVLSEFKIEQLGLFD